MAVQRVLPFTSGLLLTTVRQFHSGTRQVTRKAAYVVLGLGVAGGVAGGVAYFPRQRRNIYEEDVAEKEDLIGLWEPSKPSFSHRLQVLKRAIVLSFRWAPVFILWPLRWINEDWWWNLTLHVIQNSGPCFIKLAQWASTRLDMFPDTLCRRFSTFQANCREHSWKHTKQLLDEAFPDWPQHLTCETRPTGSGSVAQVHEGRLKSSDGMSRKVAIKVCHPNAREQIEIALT